MTSLFFGYQPKKTQENFQPAPPVQEKVTWEILTFKPWSGSVGRNISFEAVSSENKLLRQHVFGTQLSQEQVLMLLNRGITNID